MWSIFEQSPVEDVTMTNAFSSRGIFKISSEEKLQNYPRVQASVQNKKMVIAVDKSIVLLEDEMVAKCSFLSFNAQIDVIHISSSGNLIVCGLNNGEVHGIHIKGIPLFNLFIKADDVHMTCRTFAAIEQLGSCFYLSCTNGRVYYLSEIDESVLESKLHITINDNETWSFDETLFDGVTLNRLPTGSNLCDVTASVLIGQNKDVPPLLIAGTHNTVHFRSAPEETTKIIIPEHYGGTKHSFNLDNIILILTNSGHLLEVCPYTKTIMMSRKSETNLLIDEMIILDCTDDNIELLLLTKPDSDEQRLIKFVEYPSFKCTSELEVLLHSWLVQQPKCSVNLYYLNGLNMNVDNVPATIEMTVVSETHPSERFRKLIAKGHLKEAEDFGIEFELCLQPIYEAKAKRILLHMATLSDINPELLSERFEDLMKLFDRIDSKDFFINNRMVTLESRKLLEKYLKEILKHLDADADESDVLEINEQLLRLETLSIIDPYECNMEWQDLVYKSSLSGTILSLLKTDIPTACLLWKRHSCSIMPELDEHKLTLLLSHIPNNTEAFNLLQWLRQFIPTVSGTHPNMMPMITEWSIQKTRALQYSEDWPEIGLEFSTKVVEIFEDIQFMHSDIRRQHDRNIIKLRDLVNALQDLSILKKSYNLTFTLDNYLQDSIEQTALCILQRVQLCNLKSLVNDFLYPIFQEKGQSPIQAIRRYIVLLVANHNALSQWLERAVACIEHLHNEDDRMECALMVLQRSPVPWPESVAPLIKLRFSTHPLALKISTEYEIQVIKIMKVKYGWPADNAADMNLNLFMFRIVKMDLPDMLDDIRTLTKAAPEIATSAHFNCCYQLVCRGKPEVAYDFFKSLISKKDAKPAEELVELFADLLENCTFQSDDKSKEKQKNLIEFYRLLVPHADHSQRKRLLVIQNRYVLRYKFRLPVGDVRTLVSYEHRLAFFDLAIGNIIERSQATVNVSKFILSEIGELCAALQMGKVFGVHRICQRMQCLPLTCALTYAMLEYSDCTVANANDYVDLGLELVAQQILSLKKKKDSSKCSSLIGNEHDPLAYPLAYELLVRASIFKTNELSHLMELLNYIRIASGVYPLDAIERSYCGKEGEMNEIICRALDATDIPIMDSTLNYSSALNCTMDTKMQSPKRTNKRESISVFDDVDVKPSTQPTKKHFASEHMSIVKFVSHTLHLLLVEDKPSNYFLAKLQHVLVGSGHSYDLDTVREQFFCALEHLIKGKVHDVWYVMAQYLLEYQNQTQSKIINADFVSLQLGRVFRNVISHKDVNFIDLFVVLIADPHHELLLKKLNNDLKTDQQRMNYLTLCEMYNVHNDDLHRVEVIRNKRLKHYYYLEFCQQDPSIRGKFNADIDQIETLLKEFHNKQLDVNLLERMSRDFHLDYHQMLVTQILSILHGQEIQYEIITNSFGEEELVMLSSAEQIHSMCQPYINEVKNTDMLASKLKQFIGEINTYFYEMYLCVIEILGFLDAMPKEMHIWTSILQFLKHKMVTRRRQRPGQLETDMWYQSQTEIGVLPKIARYRFPFKPLVEQPLKDILDNELSIDNCESWFPLIQMHSLLKGNKDIVNVRDFYCTSAVKNCIAEYKSKNDTETWHLQPTNNSFLQSIIRLIRHVHNPSKAFMILYFVSNYAPDGADQVEASCECYNYAIEHESQITESKYQEMLVKIKRKYPILKTQHLLNIYGLTDERLMHLVENPNELIYSLYHHELVLKSSKLDINTVVKEIAELHKLDLERLQFHLLQKWLSFSADSADGTVMDETFFEDQNMTDLNGDVGNASENVIRANYILNSWSKKTAIQFLVAGNKGTVNTSKQLQIFECFSKLNDGSVRFDDSIINQRQYIIIKCVHELKRLGYNSSIDKFASCNKIDILKTIWQRNAQNPIALEILANICLGFDIYLTKIWNGILKRMTMFTMVRELNALVDVLSCQQKLLNTEGLTLAWECVLMHAFKNANQTRSFQQEEILNKTLCRLQSCPVVLKLNLLEFAEHCIRLDRPHMAAILLAFSKDPVQNAKIKKLVMPCKSEKLRKEICDLKEAGILTIVLNFALEELDL